MIRIKLLILQLVFVRQQMNKVTNEKSTAGNRTECRANAFKLGGKRMAQQIKNDPDCTQWHKYNQTKQRPAFPWCKRSCWVR